MRWQKEPPADYFDITEIKKFFDGKAMAYFEYRPNTPLFHYCGPDGFNGILESGSIWLTNLQYLNDPKELQLVEAIDNLLLELSRDPKIPADLRATYEALIPRLKGVRPHLGLYSFSLSLREDRLPMWQEYTDRGRGFCIAFRATAFGKMSLRVQKVEYAPPDYLGSIRGRIEELIRPLVGLNPKPNQIELHTLEPIATIIRLMCLASSTKDDSWHHEEEVRLVFSCSPELARHHSVKKWPIGELPDGSPVFPEDPLYRERNGQQVPYYAKPFGKWRENKWVKSGSIERVIIGPNNSQSIDDVSNYLRDLGYQNFEVVRSRCAFR